jgi:hypothetical protein
MTRKLSVETCHEFKRGVLGHPRLRKTRVRVGASTNTRSLLHHKTRFPVGRITRHTGTTRRDFFRTTKWKTRGSAAAAQQKFIVA